MARARGDKSARGRPKRSARTVRADSATPGDGAEEPEATTPVFDAVRRALTLGLSGLFTTNEIVRRAVGEAMPRDWVEFAVDQSERTRQELIDRLSGELARTLESIDLPGIAERILDGRVIEVTARIQLHKRGERGAGAPFRLAVAKDDEA